MNGVKLRAFETSDLELMVNITLRPVFRRKRITGTNWDRRVSASVSLDVTVRTKIWERVCFCILKMPDMAMMQ
jgi:hypothetical protein